MVHVELQEMVHLITNCRDGAIEPKLPILALQKPQFQWSVGFVTFGERTVLELSSGVENMLAIIAAQARLARERGKNLYVTETQWRGGWRTWSGLNIRLILRRLCCRSLGARAHRLLLVARAGIGAEELSM